MLTSKPTALQQTTVTNHSYSEKDSANVNYLEARMDDLEATIAYLENTVNSLDAVIAKQDKQLQNIQQQLRLMFARINTQNESSNTPFDMATEIPPHY